VKLTNLRWLTQNLDSVRVPLNATERAKKQGDVPYWGANGVVDYVDSSLVDEPVILIGEDGAPFFERDKDVAFCVEGNIWPNNHIHILRPNRRIINDRFICYFLNQVEYANYINGSTRDKLTQAQLGSITIRYPDLETQKAIADYLDRETVRIDLLIEKKLRLVKLLQEKLDNDTFSLITRGSNSKARMILEPELEWIVERPAHWNNHRLKHFFRENTRYSIDGTEVLFSLRMNEGLIPHNDVSDKEILPKNLIGYKKVSPGQIVMNRMRAAIGLFGLADSEGIVSPDYSVFDVSSEAHPGYFLRLFKTSPMMTAFRILSKGLGTGHSGFMRLNADRFGNIHVAIPEFEEQRTISMLVESKIKKIGEVQTQTSRSIKRLQELRFVLIAAAVTGQIDVATWGKRGDADRSLDAIKQEMAS